MSRRPSGAATRHEGVASHLQESQPRRARGNAMVAALDRRVKSLYSPPPSCFRRLVAINRNSSRTHRENRTAAIDDFDPPRGPNDVCLRGRHGGRQPDRFCIRARELGDQAVRARSPRSPQTSGTARRVAASCLLLTREARIPDGSGLFCSSSRPLGLRPSRRNAACAVTFINKMPRGSAGTGRMRASQLFADVAQMEERDHAMVEAAGSNPAFRSTFGCALAPPAARAVGPAKRGCARGRSPCAASAPGRLADHSRLDTAESGSPTPKSCALTRRAETGRKDWAAPELVTGTHVDRCPRGPRGSPAKGESAQPARAFESLTIRQQNTGGVAQPVEHLPCKQTVAGSMPVASTRSRFVSSVAERLPVEERAAGSIPARTATHAAIAQR